MNIKHLCLIAGLLGLPVANANAGEITINVPVELTNVPAANLQVRVVCMTGVGDGVSMVNRDIGHADINVPENRNYRGVESIRVTASKVDAATHYWCYLVAASGQPVLPRQNEAKGVISR
ncbi:MAG TPA: hypothetical protein VFY78_07115 [Gammaproteobacteria bacterium]|nr:hypothetical protein [Gammaproteobacteria bacterium]